MKKRLNILELTNFSAGICGVFNRVKNESILLNNLGHKVTIFSSDFEKGTWKRMTKDDKIEGIKVKRFPAIFLGGESFMNWNFKEEFLKLKPDIVIAHSFRHPHTIKVLKLSKLTGSKVILVSHAPFIEGNITRTWYETLIVNIYDRLVSPRVLNRYDCVIAITRWEIKILTDIGCDKKRIFYLPNGISEEFFTQKKYPEKLKILFLGRISPLKSIDTIIKALPFINDPNLVFEIVGVGEEKCYQNLKDLVKKLKLENRVVFTKSIFSINEKIKKIDSAKLFILASKTEALPQALLEAMARKKLVISSDNRGAKSLIRNQKNGYLFKVGDYKELANKINSSTNEKDELIRNSAKETSFSFRWNKLIIKLENLLIRLNSDLKD